MARVLSTEGLEFAVLLPKDLKLDRIQRFCHTDNTVLMWHHPLDKLQILLPQLANLIQGLVHAFTHIAIGPIGTYKDRAPVFGSVVAVAGHNPARAAVLKTPDRGLFCSDDSFSQEDLVPRDAL